MILYQNTKVIIAKLQNGLFDFKGRTCMLGIGTNDKFTLSRYFRFQLVYGIDLNLMLCDQVGKEFSWRLGTHITG